uniref:Uncharacterized protein n=1 Tax=Rhizophora mucronata TaxID=61149 RepID=A0A2P2R563_RHIMU
MLNHMFAFLFFML